GASVESPGAIMGAPTSVRRAANPPEPTRPRRGYGTSLQGPTVASLPGSLRSSLADARCDAQSPGPTVASLPGSLRSSLTDARCDAHSPGPTVASLPGSLRSSLADARCDAHSPGPAGACAER